MAEQLRTSVIFVEFGSQHHVGLLITAPGDLTPLFYIVNSRIARVTYLVFKKRQGLVDKSEVVL